MKVRGNGKGGHLKQLSTRKKGGALQLGGGAGSVKIIRPAGRPSARRGKKRKQKKRKTSPEERGRCKSALGNRNAAKGAQVHVTSRSTARGTRADPQKPSTRYRKRRLEGGSEGGLRIEKHSIDWGSVGKGAGGREERGETPWKEEECNWRDRMGRDKLFPKNSAKAVHKKKVEKVSNKKTRRNPEPRLRSIETKGLPKKQGRP